MISLTLTGNLGADCETKTLDSGKVLIRFSVAARSYGDKSTWVKVSMFKDPNSAGVSKYLTKGTRVYLRGTPEANAWTANDGTVKADLQMVAQELELLGGGEQAPQPRQPLKEPDRYEPPKPTLPPPVEGSEDALPF
jgi:single-strand DNA-binding protein